MKASSPKRPGPDFGREVLVVACGPRPGGNSDTAAALVARELAAQGVQTGLVHLRDYRVKPCVGCQTCGRADRRGCFLADADDDAEALFAHFLANKAYVLVSPIYFYHLPAHFKAFVDRSQAHYEAWARGEAPYALLPKRQAFCLFVAGRPRGDKLFEGSLLSLRIFAKTFGVELGEHLGLRGLDAAGDLAASEPSKAQVTAFAGTVAAHALGRRAP